MRVETEAKYRKNQNLRFYMVKSVQGCCKVRDGKSITEWKYESKNK